MIGETSISLNENVQRVTDVNDVEPMPGVQNLSYWYFNSREEALNPSSSESSWLRVNRSSFHERRCGRRRGSRRRWKLSNCFRCTSAVRDEAHKRRYSLFERRTTHVLLDIH
ncbi:hypothetical protein PUN28_017708 [Cardiocondyla obscurior]|uniref:Uncharacterized protein n=1 Tax=Cardiocondyla obscurior TaxID=286306 RepID=A0AAW2EIQ1_9HYME